MCCQILCLNLCLPLVFELFCPLSPQAQSYSDKIMHMLLQNSTTLQEEDEGVKVVKLKQGTTALVTRTLNPEVDDNSAVMVVKEVRKSVTVCILTVSEYTNRLSRIDSEYFHNIYWPVSLITSAKGEIVGIVCTVWKCQIVFCESYSLMAFPFLRLFLHS